MSAVHLSLSPLTIIIIRKEGNVLYNDALNIFYLWLYGKGPLSERENLLQPLHGLHF